MLGQRGEKKNTVEGCIIISAAEFQRGGMLRPHLHAANSLIWSNADTGERVAEIGFEVNLWADYGSVGLRYEVEKAGAAQRVNNGGPAGWWWGEILIFAEHPPLRSPVVPTSEEEKSQAFENVKVMKFRDGQ